MLLIITTITIVLIVVRTKTNSSSHNNHNNNRYPKAPRTFRCLGGDRVWDLEAMAWELGRNLALPSYDPS